MYLIQGSGPGRVTGIEWVSLHCQQSKCLLGGSLPLTLPQSLLPGQTGLHSVVSSAPSVLFFFFSSSVSLLSMMGWLCLRSSRCLEAAGAGSNPRAEWCLSEPFPHTLRVAGAQDRGVRVQCRRLDPISSPDCCFPIPGAKLVPGTGGSLLWRVCC